VHPGIVGDRGPSSLDWAIQEGVSEWGVTVLQANAVMDGGDIWATHAFPLRTAKKSSIYRSEVADAAVRAVLEALTHYPDYVRGDWKPTPPNDFKTAVRGSERPSIQQAQRAIDWQHDDTATVLRKLNAADGCPGVKDKLFGQPCHLFDAHAAMEYRGAAGEVIGRSGDAVLRATTDGAVWIGHVRRLEPDARALRFCNSAYCRHGTTSLRVSDAVVTGCLRGVTQREKLCSRSDASVHDTPRQRVRSPPCFSPLLQPCFCS
jgi:putative two-component system hydrogenase maturation factor HypX/HoxX